VNPYTDTTQPRSALHGPRRERDGAKNRCGVDCVRPTPSQAHCGARGCHRTFGGVTGFDAHRKDGICADPATLGMVVSDLGIWRTPMSDDARERLEATR
jgi:hypothetical protein